MSGSTGGSPDINVDTKIAGLEDDFHFVLRVSQSNFQAAKDLASENEQLRALLKAETDKHVSTSTLCCCCGPLHSAAAVLQTIRRLACYVALKIVGSTFLVDRRPVVLTPIEVNQ